MTSSDPSNLTLCMLDNFTCFLLSADFFFENLFFFKKIFSGMPSVLNTLDPDQPDN